MMDFEFVRRVVIGVCIGYLNVQMFTYIGKNLLFLVWCYHVMLILRIWLFGFIISLE